MNIHNNARLTPKGRELLIGRLERGEHPHDVACAMGVSVRTVYIYGCLSRCKVSLELNWRPVPGCKHLSGVAGLWRAQMGIPRGEPQQMVGLDGPL